VRSCDGMSAVSLLEGCGLVAVHGIMALVKCHRSRSMASISIGFALVVSCFQFIDSGCRRYYTVCFGKLGDTTIPRSEAAPQSKTLVITKTNHPTSQSLPQPCFLAMSAGIWHPLSVPQHQATEQSPSRS
jgi:hypothetical protein